jgi:putative phosphoribosyl transferase
LRGQVLAVAPGTAGAVLVALLTARDTDHVNGYTRCEMPQVPFPDRRSAGLLLAGRLGSFAASRVVVLALPRGGVPVALPIGERLGAPVDVLVTRKIGYPPQPELGVGAIAEGGEPVYDEGMLAALGLRPEDLAETAELERAEVSRRVRVYRQGRPLPELTGRCVVLADDGLATGVTARAAVRAARRAGAARVIMAAPVASEPAVESMQAETDEVVTLITPRRFRSVGEWYASFGQLTDSEVLDLLEGGSAGRRQLDAAQAAFARRIRRRRSAERSSSLSPPQVPYFSGRETA